MDQQKIGEFIRELRKEKSLSQEQFAEALGVTGRTVSRWETARNMPDISMLVDISEYFDVSIPEIIAGERKSEKMNDDVKEVMESISDYSDEIRQRRINKVKRYSFVGLVLFVIDLILAAEVQSRVPHNIFLTISDYVSSGIKILYIVMFVEISGLLEKTQKGEKKELVIFMASFTVIQLIVIIVWMAVKAHGI